jgi:Fe-S oxidoreductase
MSGTFAEGLQARAQQVLDSCTSCGRCFEVCPMTAPAGLAGRDAKRVTGGVLDIIRGADVPPDSQRWAQVCSGSGSCIPACPEGVNPRFMLALARVAIQRRASAEEQHSKGSAAFAKMGRGVRVLSRMQLPADVLRRFRGDGPAETPPEVVFYTGCNVLKTPHIVLLALDILDALGVSYRVMGGPGDCCGVIQFRTGDLDASGRVAWRTCCPRGRRLRPTASSLSSSTWRGSSTGCARSCAIVSRSGSRSTSTPASRACASLPSGS